MEAGISIDVLRRAQWQVVSASIGTSQTLTGSRGVKVVADAMWTEVDPTSFDVIVLPGGGPGSARLRAHEGVLRAVRTLAASDRWVAAICAAPTVLEAAGVLAGRKATCHPDVSFEQLPRATERVVQDGKCLTSQGPGTAIEFSLALIAAMDGEAKAASLAKGMAAAR